MSKFVVGKGHSVAAGGRVYSEGAPFSRDCIKGDEVVKNDAFKRLIDKGLIVLTSDAAEAAQAKAVEDALKAADLKADESAKNTTPPPIVEDKTQTPAKVAKAGIQKATK
jgi:hypothetical protein